MAGSLLCVLHCVSTPLLIGYLSTVGLGFLGQEIFHQVLAVALLAVAVFAFLPGYRMHRRTSIVVTGVLGIFLLLTAGFAPEGLLPAYADVTLTIAGSVLLVTAHVFNRRCNDACQR